ncbi:MAG: serine--tRNA ligase, partial [Limisphaerales bacterium]
MLDIKLIREQTDFVRKQLASRQGGDEKLIDGILRLDEERRKILTEVEQHKA